MQMADRPGDIQRTPHGGHEEWNQETPIAPLLFPR
jgi:hypothetical protein